MVAPRRAVEQTGTERGTRDMWWVRGVDAGEEAHNGQDLGLEWAGWDLVYQ